MKKIYQMTSAYMGKEYTQHEISSAIYSLWSGDVQIPTDLYRHTAELIAANKIVGWFQGKSEFGPRALGNRSILANPANPDMKDWLNQRVKFREHFRPFAPLMLKEYVHEYFGEDIDSPYMLLVKEFQPEKRKCVPSVVHVDGTGRLQTVTKEENMQMHKLLLSLYSLTGIPIVLNTSFNVKGEPIVESPQDAIRCFMGTNIDVLVLGDYILNKNERS